MATQQQASRWDQLRGRLADRLPVRARARWQVAPRCAVAGALVALAVAGGAGARVLVSSTSPPPTIRIAPARSPAQVDPAGPGSAQPAPVSAPVNVPPSVPGATSGRLVPTAAPAAEVVVDVVGQVRRPGLVRLPVGSRVADAVRAAGGAGPHAVLEQLNLARVLADGEQILVPRPGQTALPPAGGPPEPGGPGGGQAGGPAGGTGAVIDLNQADESQLDELPGIGPVLAARILAWRTAHGRFTSVDELAEVSGIGSKLLSNLRPLVRVG